MKKVNYVLGALMLMLFASCSGGSKDDPNAVTLTIEPQLGELANYISIADSEAIVKLIDDKEDGKDVKSIASSIAISVNEGVASNYDYRLDVVVLDENHIEITTLPDYVIDSKWDVDNSKYRYVLYRGDTRAQMKTTQDATEWSAEDQEEWDKIRTRGKYIVIKSDNSMTKYVPYNSDSSSNSASSENDGNQIDNDEVDIDEDDSSSIASSSSDADFDEFLTAYEDYINKYIALLQKAKNGDYSAMTEAATLMQDAQEYGEKLQNVSGSLTSAQIAKFQKLQQKLLKAAQ